MLQSHGCRCFISVGLKMWRQTVPVLRMRIKISVTHSFARPFRAADAHAFAQPFAENGNG